MARSESQQSVFSSYAPRLRTYNNSLLTPVLPGTAPANPLARTTKRGTTIINYAEDGYDDYDDDDDNTRSRRRPTGLRSVQPDDGTVKADPAEKVGKDTHEPVEVQGIWREWMGRFRQGRSDQQNFAQASLPLTLIPIRIDLDIPSYTPPASLPPNAANFDPNSPLLKPSEPTVPYRLRDTFLWNLHETLITTDQFATVLVQDLDLPNRNQTISEISKQIRTQLEEYAGVALHPLFHSHRDRPAATEAPKQLEAALATSTPNTPAVNGTTPTNGTSAAAAAVQTSTGEITAAATPIPRRRRLQPRRHLPLHHQPEHQPLLASLHGQVRVVLAAPSRHRRGFRQADVRRPGLARRVGAGHDARHLRGCA